MTNNLTFLMSGQGSQYQNMGNEFIQQHSHFKNKFNECLEYLDKHGCSLSEVWGNEEINQTKYTQGALFAIEYASACFWQHHGITPHILIGHSIGEIVAATFAGVMSLDQACFLVTQRSKLMDAVNVDGAMLAILAPENKWIKTLPNSLDIALYNAESQIVVSGLSTDIKAYASLLKDHGIRSIEINVSHPFHSRFMSGCVNDFEASISNIAFKKPDFPIIGNVNATVIDQYDSSYWGDHIIEPVKFYQSIQLSLKLGANVFLECGPQPTLVKIIKRSLPENITTLYTMDKNIDSEKHVFDVLKSLSKLGFHIKI